MDLGEWLCGICDIKMHERTPSITCKKCLNWVHLKCAGMSYSEARKIKATYQCKKCENVMATTALETGTESLSTPPSVEQAGTYKFHRHVKKSAQQTQNQDKATEEEDSEGSDEEE